MSTVTGGNSTASRSVYEHSVSIARLQSKCIAKEASIGKRINTILNLIEKNGAPSKIKRLSNQLVSIFESIERTLNDFELHFGEPSDFCVDDWVEQMRFDVDMCLVDVDEYCGNEHKAYRNDFTEFRSTYCEEYDQSESDSIKCSRSIPSRPYHGDFQMEIPRNTPVMNVNESREYLMNSTTSSLSDREDTRQCLEPPKHVSTPSTKYSNTPLVAIHPNNSIISSPNSSPKHVHAPVRNNGHYPSSNKWFCDDHLISNECNNNTNECNNNIDLITKPKTKSDSPCLVIPDFNSSATAWNEFFFEADNILYSPSNLHIAKDNGVRYGLKGKLNTSDLINSGDNRVMKHIIKLLKFICNEKMKISGSHLKRVLSLKITEDKVVELWKCLRNCNTALLRMGSYSTLTSPEVLELVTGKLPADIGEKWRMCTYLVGARENLSLLEFERWLKNYILKQ